MTGYGHDTVMREEVIESIRPVAAPYVIDATLGGGGHTRAVLEMCPHATVVAIDRDPQAISFAKNEFSGDSRVHIFHAAFSQIDLVAEKAGCHAFDLILADIGVSSPQFDKAERGFSFRFEGPIDMRMNTASGITALELIDQLTEQELADVIYEFGEERRSRRVAKAIKAAHKNGTLHTTTDLAAVITSAVGNFGKTHSATRTFQALRIAVNEELSELRQLLEKAPPLLKLGGHLAIVSFHSLEDRIVKHFIRRAPGLKPVNRKPRLATKEEIQRNARARSAKLRVAKRVEEKRNTDKKIGGAAY